MIRTDTKTAAILKSYFDVDAEEQTGFLDKLEEVLLPGGDWLFHQGDPGNSFYLLLRGRLQAWQESNADGPLDSPQLLGSIAPGQSVGELALLTGGNRTAGVRAVRDSQLLKVGKAAFLALSRDHPSMVLKLAARAAGLANPGTDSVMRKSRKPVTVALVPLCEDTRTEQLVRDVCSELVNSAGANILDPQARGARETPLEALGVSGEISEGLAAWVEDQESRSDLLVFRCDGRGGAWNRFAVRQADLVVLVALASADPGPRALESELGLDSEDHAARRMLVLLQDDDKFDFMGTKTWLSGRRLEYHLHAREGSQADLQRVSRMISGSGTGIVFGAGASRGFAHLGVFRALVEAGVPVDWVGGTSIGAIMGAPLALGWEPSAAIEMIRDAFVNGRPFSDFTLPLVSLLSGRRMRRLLHEHLDLDIEDLLLPFYCVSSRLNDGQPVIHRTGNMARALRATASIPGILPPTVVNGQLSVDGSVLNSLPVDLMWQAPVDRVIAVSLASTGAPTVSYEDTPSAWSILWSRVIPFGTRHRVPSLMSVLLKATELAAFQDVEAQGARATLLLRPDVRKYGLTQVDAFDEIVEEGYRCAVEALEKW